MSNYPFEFISSKLEWAPYIPPDNIPVFNTTDYQLGGIGLSNPTAGLQYQYWFLQLTGTVTSNNVVISAPNTPETTLFSAPNITEISLAFDQNMRPAVAYVSQGNPYFWWYDTTIPGYTVITLPAGATHPRCTLDDKRSTEISLGLSNMIVAYINSDNLYCRAQKDRFTVEYSLYTNLSQIISNPILNKIGMNEGERLQFQLLGQLYQ
jgi:hypothetical protein